MYLGGMALASHTMLSVVAVDVDDVHFGYPKSEMLMIMNSDVTSALASGNICAMDSWQRLLTSSNKSIPVLDVLNQTLPVFSLDQ